MEACCHVWAGAASCYLDIWDKLQKKVSRNVGLTESLVYCQNVASLRPIYRYYFGLPKR